MFFKNRKKDIKKSEDEFQHISERRTSILGYILLIIMAVFIIIVGETIFADLEDLPTHPVRVSYCIDRAITGHSTSYYNSYSLCEEYTTQDMKFGLNTEYEALKPDLANLKSLEKKLSELKRTSSSTQRNLDTKSRDYDLSLQERMANQNAILNPDELGGVVQDLQYENDYTYRQIDETQEKIDALQEKLFPQLAQLEVTYDEAYADYKTQLAWHNFKVFLLHLLFVVPFFYLSVKYYLRLKRKDSPHTIILTSATGAFSILFIQIVLVFLYDILPTEWIGEVLEFLLDAPFLRYIIYYGSVIVVIAIFGGIVYYIQKNIFAPAKVAMRRIKDSKCPQCSFRLNDQHKFCPKCSLELKKICSECGDTRLAQLPFCPSCGKK